MRGEQCVRHALATAAGERIVERQLRALQHAARQRVTVGVKPARGEADESVARADGAAVQQPTLVEPPDHAAGDVDHLRQVGVGHLGRFAAQQCRAHLAAGARHALDRGERGLGVEPCLRDVVEERER